ncbi:MAG: TldD/PmbA family protein [Dethiobacteria bacterium]|nr:TldD/PmbA family protein [Bacillota bacterium]HOJ83774.1 TldD/PmbA family protein [Bacillota bacterium]HQE10251.1 TldD/PmbA family protein [Bacillota bacterium]
MQGGIYLRTLNLHDYKGLFTAYTELRVQENRSVNITFVKGNNTLNLRSSTGGISARVCRNGSWGFASHPGISEENVKTVIRAATDNALFLDSKEQKEKDPLPAVPASSENDFSTSRPRLSQKDLVEFIRELDDHIASSYPQLAGRTLSLRCLDMEKRLLTSDGSYSHSMIPRSFIYIQLSVIKNGSPVELFDVYGGLGQFEDQFSAPGDLFEEVARQYHHLIKKSEGVFADAGLKTCVLDADLAGILAHEAIGHTVEADIVMSGSVAGDKIGREVASPLITMIDFANSYQGETCPVPVYVDDEGTAAKDAVLIKEGVLKSFLHNKESANHYRVAPAGNARAYAYSDEPLIRMRNTVILPGTSTLEDMIASVDDGYYLIRPGNGQADSTSEFMFGIVLGYEIKKGKIGRAIKDTTISGVAFDVLKTVSMVSGEMSWMSGGMCGKKQPIPVGMGGPAIKCQLNVGGR